MKTLILFVLKLLFYITDAQKQSSFLPKSGECGQLKEQYLYNSKHISAVDEFPWMGRLKFTSTKLNEGTSYKGLAVLISRRHLLANARFFQDVNDYESVSVELGWNTAGIRIGSKDNCDAFGNCAPPPTEYEIEEVAVHPDFRVGLRILHNDISVLRLRDEVKFSAYARPICLPTSLALNNLVARYLPYTGFSRSQGSETEQLKILGLIMSSKSCVRIKNETITDGLMCAVSIEQAYPLDYGSALMGVSLEDDEPHHYYLIGLLSESGVSAVSPTPDILVRIAAYIDWILYNIY